MGTEFRPVSTLVDFCDLCGEKLPDGRPDERGSLTGGWLSHPITARTKRTWLLWPPPDRARRASWQERQKPEMRERKYDFHSECILRLVEEAIAARSADVGESR